MELMILLDSLNKLPNVLRLVIALFLGLGTQVNIGQ